MSFASKVNGQRVHDAIKKHGIKLDLETYGNSIQNCGCYIGVCFYDDKEEWVDKSHFFIHKWLEVSSAFLDGFNTATLPEPLRTPEQYLEQVSSRYNFKEIEKEFYEGFAEGERVHNEYLNILNEEL